MRAEDDRRKLAAFELAATGGGSTPPPEPAVPSVPPRAPIAPAAPAAPTAPAATEPDPPALAPEVIAAFAIGGEGDQYIREVGFDGDIAWATGLGFSARIDPRTGAVTVQGDPGTEDPGGWSQRFARPAKANVQVSDPRNGQSYAMTTLQVHPLLQQPLLTSSAGWKLWGWSHQQVAEGTADVRWGPLMADSRGYDVWLMPGGRIGALCWTDGGNSVLTRDPRDLARTNEAVERGDPFRATPGGLATLFLLIDPGGGTPLSGTFVRGHATNRAVDAFGRVYLPTPQDGATPFAGAAADAGGGLFVLDPTLRRPELNIRLGAGAAEGGSEGFAVLALNGNLLVLGGTGNHPDLPGVRGLPKGRAQDGWVVLLRLWPDQARP